MNDPKAFWLAEAESYLRTCQAEKRTVRASEFALRLRRTPARLAHEFHRSVGFCIKDYFCSRQVEHAKQLLRTTARTTAEIAVQAGFGTARTFYRAFRRATGVSPTEYRRAYRRKEMSLVVPDFAP